MSNQLGGGPQDQALDCSRISRSESLAVTRTALIPDKDSDKDTPNPSNLWKALVFKEKNSRSQGGDNKEFLVLSCTVICCTTCHQMLEQ